MNNVQIIGRLARDPDMRKGSSRAFVCKMTVAVDYGYGDKKETSFIPVVVFGNVAENCEKYLSKGSQVAVTGRIRTGSYEKDGRKVYTTDVIANNVEFLDSKGSGQQSQKAEAPVQEQMPSGFMQVEDDSLPF